MTTALLIAVVLVAAFACPAMMWFQDRRGKSAPCCPPGRASAAEPRDLDQLRADHARLSAELADLEARSGDAATVGAPTAPRAS